MLESKPMDKPAIPQQADNLKTIDQEKTGNDQNNNGINKDEVDRLAIAGLSQQRIAEIQGVQQPAISKYLKKVDLEKQRLEQFKNNKANEFEQDQLESIDIQRNMKQTWDRKSVVGMTEVEKRALFYTLTTEIGVKQDKIQALRGQATHIVGITSQDMQDHEARQIRRAELLKAAQLYEVVKG